MTNIHDYHKALEQKKKKVEIKGKLNDSGENFVRDIIESSGIYESYNELSNKYNELFDLMEKIHKNYEIYYNLFMLTEHFVVKNNLQKEFISFMKHVAENEIVYYLREAAQCISEHYNDVDTLIIDRYGMMLEDEEYHQKMAELDKGEI